MSKNTLREVYLRYNNAILDEACERFGFVRTLLEKLDGSAFVYEGPLNGKNAILKISPGLQNTKEKILGATREQILGELDFIRYLDGRGVPVALPIPSRTGNWVESIPLDDEACFLVCAFEKVPGFMYLDEAEVEFPEPVLVEWGRLLGQLHRLSGDYQPSNPAWRRLGWESDDLLDYRSLLPAGQPLVWQRYEEMIAILNNLPRDPQVFGLVHGDLHHGNFFNDNGRLIAFDFDAAHYFWYAGDIVIALYNCLPMPRSETAKRRAFALHFLSHILKGYALEKPLDPAWIARLPFFLKWNELLDYSHHHKYWDMDNLSERRRAILANIRRRIENEIPVVEFQPGDLEF
jgi:Ser/Thr protein kinase RdoA (MazF antagonist)